MIAAPISRTMSPLQWGMLLSLSLLWGGSFFFAEIAVRELPPLTIVATRVGLAALILNLVVLGLRVPVPRDGRVWAAFFAMGLLNNAIPFTLIVWGQIHIASGLASILNATTPIVTVVIAHVLTHDERMTVNRLAGVVVGFLGVVVIVGPTALQALGADLVAQLACLAAAVCYGFAGVFGRRFRALGVDPMVTATGQVTASSVMLIPSAVIVDRPWLLPLPSVPALGSLVGIAVLSTALAYVLYFRILATAGATNLLLVTFLIPVSAILLGSLVLGEQLDAQHFAGMALIGVGLAAIDGRLMASRRRTEAKRP